MNEERRLMLALALSLGVILSYRSFLQARYPQSQAAATPATAPPGSDAHAPARATPTPTTTTASAVQPGPVVPTPGPQIRGEEQRVETTLSGAEVAFASKGARLLSWRLTQHHDVRGRAIELLPGVSSSLGPLDIETPSAELNRAIRELPFRVTRSREAAGENLTFEYQDDALHVTKTVTPIKDGRVLRIEARVEERGVSVSSRVRFGPGLGQATEAEKAVQGYRPPQVAAVSPAGETRMSAKDVSKRAESNSGPVVETAPLIGIETKYFAAMFANENASPLQAHLFAEGEGSDAAVTVSVPTPVTLTIAAKDYDALKSIGLGGEKIVPVGSWIGPIVLPLTRALRAVNARVGNYGWSIILLTLGISLAMAPLRQYSIIMGAKMAKIAPQIRAVQARYKGVPFTDPRTMEMQREIQEIQAKHGLDATKQLATGCLPMLLTMPFLFAFYRMLDISVDLKGAPFLWIPDLSLKDPFYLTPLMTGVSMFAMQRFMPAATDPVQQQMMRMMPLMVTAFSTFAPAGLNVYWFVSNTFSLLQQSLTRALAPHLFPKANKTKN